MFSNAVYIKNNKKIKQSVCGTGSLILDKDDSLFGIIILEGQVLVFISPRNRVAQLYPQALGFLFVASYDSQGYGGALVLKSWCTIFFV
jgi:hypothetical protein